MSIWVNVTNSVSWRGPLVGIIRVERNIAKGVRELLGNDRVRYCVWVPRRNAFVEWKPGTPGNGRRDRLYNIGRALCRPLPGKAKLAVADLALLGGRAIRRVSDGLSAWLPRARSTGDVGLARAPAPAGCLHRGDVLVTLGLEWETGFMPQLPRLKERLGIRVIGCVHDIIPVKFPQYCMDYVAELFPRYLSELARSCDSIACVSECTRRDLLAALARMGGPLPATFTIRLGADLPRIAKPPVEEVARVVKQPYVLFVSTIERRKNHEVLYRAFRRLAEHHKRETLPRLVFVGALGWGVDDLLAEIERDPLTEGLILQLNGVSDNDLRVLYQNALFSVFPSLYEGWGLPVAEALSVGKPVICSDRGSLPEVGGDLVDYVDPWDLPGWVRAIEKLWLDASYRQRAAERITREYRAVDWSEAAETIGEIAMRLEGTPGRKPQMRKEG